MSFFEIDFRKNKTLRQFSTDYRNLIQRIYRAEVKAEEDSNKSVSTYMEDYAEDFLSFEPKETRVPYELKKLAKEIKKGKRGYEVYDGLISEEIITFLKTSEAKGVKASMVFARYAPIKEMGERAMRGVRRKLIVPMGLLVLFILGIYYIMGTFREIYEDGVIPLGDSAVFIMDHFVAITVIYAAIFAYLLIIIPQKLPGLKKIFANINGMLALASMDIMHYISYDAGQMIMPIRQQFKIKRNHPRRDIFGLTDILYHEGYITKDQGSEMRRETELSVAIERALEEKKETVEGLNEVVQDAVKELSLLLLALPLFLMLYVLANLMLNAADQLGGVGV
jgi:hypothetical protein